MREIEVKFKALQSVTFKTNLLKHTKDACKVKHIEKLNQTQQ